MFIVDAVVWVTEIIFWMIIILAGVPLALTAIAMFFTFLWIIYDISCQTKDNSREDNIDLPLSKPPLPSRFYGLNDYMDNSP